MDKKNIHWLVNEIDDTVSLAISYGTSKTDIVDYIPTGYYKINSILNKNGTETWKIFTDDNALFDFLGSSLVCFKNIFDDKDEITVPLSKLLMLYNLAKFNKRSPLDMVDYEDVTKTATDSLKKYNDNDLAFYGMGIEDIISGTKTDSKNYSIVPFVNGEMSNQLKAILFTAFQIDRGKIDDNLDALLLSCQMIFNNAKSLPSFSRVRKYD